MAAVARPRSRRDVFLDSGALSALAMDVEMYASWRRLLRKTYEGAIFVPTVVLTECFTGDQRDAYLYRFLNSVNGPGARRAFVPAVDFGGAVRAGALRTRAMKAFPARRAISVTDAQLVALAEAQSFGAGVTVLTGDPIDVQALVDCTGRRNIAVDTV